MKVNNIEVRGKYTYITYNNEQFEFLTEVCNMYNIDKNKDFMEVKFREILYFSRYQETYNYAIKLLSYGDKSIKEIKDKLYERELYEIDKVIDALINNKLLDDERYAYNVLTAYMAINKGPLYIRNKLRNKGIKEKIINNVLSNYTIELEEEKARILAESVLKNIENLTIKKQKGKVYSKLLNSGFSPCIINDFIMSHTFNTTCYDNIDIIVSKLKYKYSRKNLSSEEIDELIIKKLLRDGYTYSKIKDALNK